MPDLPKRAEYERQLAGVLVLLWDSKDAMLAGGIDTFHSRAPAEIAPILAAAYRDSATQLADGKIDAAHIDAAAAAWGEQYAERLAAEIANGTQAMANQQSTQAISDARAATIAATEVTRAAVAAELSAAAAMTLLTGTKMKPLWHTSEDDAVCEVCEPLNGTGPEIYGLVSIDGPPAHPNCRCWLDWE